MSLADELRMLSEESIKQRESREALNFQQALTRLCEEMTKLAKSGGTMACFSVPKRWANGTRANLETQGFSPCTMEAGSSGMVEFSVCWNKDAPLPAFVPDIGSVDADGMFRRPTGPVFRTPEGFKAF